jgi:hypothetical protein
MPGAQEEGIIRLVDIGNEGNSQKRGDEEVWELRFEN